MLDSQKIAVKELLEFAEEHISGMTGKFTHGSFRLTRLQTVQKIVINWLWMALSIILISTGLGAFAGIPALILGIFFYIIWVKIWKNYHGYSAALLNIFTLIFLLGIVAASDSIKGFVQIAFYRIF